MKKKKGSKKKLDPWAILALVKAIDCLADSSFQTSKKNPAVDKLLARLLKGT